MPAGSDGNNVVHNISSHKIPAHSMHTAKRLVLQHLHTQTLPSAGFVKTSVAGAVALGFALWGVLAGEMWHKIGSPAIVSCGALVVR